MENDITRKSNKKPENLGTPQENVNKNHELKLLRS